MSFIRTAEGPNSQSGRIRGKVALVVGGGAGIGKATAQKFASEGAHVMVADLQTDAAEAVAVTIHISGGIAAHASVDVTVEESVKTLVATTLARFGRIDILFNSAGGSSSHDAPIDVVDLDVWGKTMSLDVLGAIHCARHVVPSMIATGGGSIVMMSSGVALRGSGRAHIYAAAKGAVNSLTRAMAGAYAKNNIRVNAICCGRINTERVRDTYGIPGDNTIDATDPFDARSIVEEYPYWLGEPIDIANIALFLASDESCLITGAEIPANGGRSAY